MWQGAWCHTGRRAAEAVAESHILTHRGGGLKMLGPGNGSIRRCGLIGVGVALLEEACHCEGRL